MGCIAVQCAIGDVGEKALTELSPSYESLVNTGRFQYGLNETGIYLLNTGNTYANVSFTKSFTFAESDLGVDENKRLRFLYIHLETIADASFTIKTTFDGVDLVTTTKVAAFTGLKIIKIPFNSSSCIGDYITLSIESTSQFRLHKINALIIPRALGRR